MNSFKKYQQNSSLFRFFINVLNTRIFKRSINIFCGMVIAILVGYFLKKIGADEIYSISAKDMIIEILYLICALFIFVVFGILGPFLMYVYYCKFVQIKYDEECIYEIHPSLLKYIFNKKIPISTVFGIGSIDGVMLDIHYKSKIGPNIIRFFGEIKSIELELRRLIPNTDIKK